MDLSFKQTQTVTVTPKLIATMSILQMSAAELMEHIYEMSMENPLVSLPEQEDSAFTKKLKWLGSYGNQSKAQYVESDEEYDPFATTAMQAGTLCEHLNLQLGITKLPRRIKRAAEYIVGLLDENGFLAEDEDELHSVIGCDQGTAKEALLLIQSLDPAGVGARDVQHSLVLQLERLGESPSVSREIVTHHLHDIAAGRYEKMAGELHAPCDEIRHAIKVIKTLQPHPAASFTPFERPVYIVPDVCIVERENGLEVVANDEQFPSINVNKYYLDLLNQDGDKELTEYLQSKLNQLEWTVRNIDNRKSTVVAIVETIVKWQEDYLLGRTDYLAPMALSDITGDIGMHESTVSRAAKDKYVQCSKGVLPISLFFVRSLGYGHSVDSIKHQLRKLIEQESPEAPLSDREICEILSKSGTQISRRTVAKYRMEMGIAPTSIRKVTSTAS